MASLASFSRMGARVASVAARTAPRTTMQVRIWSRKLGVFGRGLRSSRLSKGTRQTSDFDEGVRLSGLRFVLLSAQKAVHGERGGTGVLAGCSANVAPDGWTRTASACGARKRYANVLSSLSAFWCGAGRTRKRISEASLLQTEERARGCCAGGRRGGTRVRKRSSGCARRQAVAGPLETRVSRRAHRGVIVRNVWGGEGGAACLRPAAAGE